MNQRQTEKPFGKLGKYRLIAELARGGMGIVWLAEMRGPGGFTKTCVVKELLPELANDPHHRAMFLDEASLAARLSHKNIVQTNEVGCEGDEEGDGGGQARLFMALELLEGCTLRRAQTLLSEQGGVKGANGARLPTALAVRIVCEMLSALEYAHDARDRETGKSLAIVHRDVTPQNVFLTFDGQVKLLDFGVAKSRARREQTREGVAKGCIAYMSPDHLARAPIDQRADLFAVGVVLRELLTGRRLWDDLEDERIVRRLIVGELPPFPTGKGDKPSQIPSVLRRICETAMENERSDRFTSAGHMREALEWWLSNEDPSGSLVSGLQELFDGALSIERTRVQRQLHRVRPQPWSAKPPPPLPLPRIARPQAKAASMAPAEIALPSTDLATAPTVSFHSSLRSRSSASLSSKVRRLPKRELFVAVMALVASIAAAVSVARSGDDDPQQRSVPGAHEVVIVTNVATKANNPPTALTP